MLSQISPIEPNCMKYLTVDAEKHTTTTTTTTTTATTTTISTTTTSEVCSICLDLMWAGRGGQTTN